MYRHLAVALVAAHVAAPVELALTEFYARLEPRGEAAMAAHQVATVDGV